jgi:two-component SAPR family response regulator
MIDCKPMIVVVHEDRQALDALEMLLSENNYLPATFTSVLRSIEFVKRNKPDLVLIQEPENKSEGIEFLESIKRISPATEGVFLPSPLSLNPVARRLNRGQADELLRIIDRLLGIMVIPERRRAPQSRPVVA